MGNVGAVIKDRLQLIFFEMMRRRAKMGGQKGGQTPVLSAGERGCSSILVGVAYISSDHH
jgi:hypothetical protein